MSVATKSSARIAVAGPTYREMLHPELLPAETRKRATAALGNELDPANLFNITWQRPDGGIRHVSLPSELTGVDANILVMTGCGFPSGSHKVGPAYSTLMEGELAGEIKPGEHTIIGPSTGNFGIGVAYIAKLKGYEAIVIMPDGMSQERYQRIQKYGGKLDLTPGSESDVILVLERTEFYKKQKECKVLAQFELLPNYRFHRYVTGQSALRMAEQYGNKRVAAFVSAPGSAGTIAAGDEIKSKFPESLICALEPSECSTLFNNGRGTHRIEGIGDKMVTLIHNVLTTDFVQLIHDDDCVIGLDLLQQHAAEVENSLKLKSGTVASLAGIFGVSSICNILGAIRFARHMGFKAGENVVTIATDGFDRYPSVIEDLGRRKPARSGADLDARFEQIYRGFDKANFLDVRPDTEKQRLFRYKEEVWSKFGYTRAYLDEMKHQSFWDVEYGKIGGFDKALEGARFRS